VRPILKVLTVRPILKVVTVRSLDRASPAGGPVPPPRSAPPFAARRLARPERLGPHCADRDQPTSPRTVRDADADAAQPARCAQRANGARGPVNRYNAPRAPLESREWGPRAGQPAFRAGRANGARGPVSRHGALTREWGPMCRKPAFRAVPYMLSRITRPRTHRDCAPAPIAIARDLVKKKCTSSAAARAKWQAPSWGSSGGGASEKPQKPR